MFISSLVLLSLAAEPLVSGIDLYERGLYEKSRAALAKVLDSKASDADKNRARLYLAADYFALGDRRGALYALEDLARKDADQKIDSSVFPPEFLKLWAEAKEHVDAERPKPAPAVEPPPAAQPVPEEPPKPAPPEAVAPVPAEAPRSYRFLAIVPAAAAIASGVWGTFSWSQARSYYALLTGTPPPATLAEGQALAARGNAANRDAAIGLSIFAGAAALAIALLFLL